MEASRLRPHTVPAAWSAVRAPRPAPHGGSGPAGCASQTPERIWTRAPHRAVPAHQVEFVAKKGPEAESSSFNVDGNLFKTAVLRMEAPSAHLATPSHT